MAEQGLQCKYSNKAEVLTFMPILNIENNPLVSMICINYFSAVRLRGLNL